MSDFDDFDADREAMSKAQGRALRLLRKYYGITLGDAAKALGVSTSTFSSLERARLPTTPEDAARQQAVHDLLHPMGVCQCWGEGRCEYCKVRLTEEGVEVVR